VLPCYLQEVLDLSQDQTADLMRLRQLFLTKRRFLALERKRLVSFLATFDDQLLHPSDNSTTATDLVNRLKDNALEDQQVLFKVVGAVWFGVCPPVWVLMSC